MKCLFDVCPKDATVCLQYSYDPQCQTPYLTVACEGHAVGWALSMMENALKEGGYGGVQLRLMRIDCMKDEDLVEIESAANTRRLGGSGGPN